MANEARHAILGRIRQALKAPSPEPHWSHGTVKTDSLFPLPEPTIDALWDRFAAELTALFGLPYRVADAPAAQRWASEKVSADAVRSILAVDCPPVRSLLSNLPAEVKIEWVRGNVVDRSGWDKFDLGVTPCESLVAESGTVVVSSLTAGRAPSVLPPIHWAVATPDQLVPDLGTAIDRLKARNGNKLPSSISFITGPSRTADIEKILVLGAHGPKKLTVVLFA